MAGRTNNDSNSERLSMGSGSERGGRFWCELCGEFTALAVVRFHRTYRREERSYWCPIHGDITGEDVRPAPDLHTDQEPARMSKHRWGTSWGSTEVHCLDCGA